MQHCVHLVSECRCVVFEDMVSTAAASMKVFSPVDEAFLREQFIARRKNDNIV